MACDVGAACRFEPVPRRGRVGHGFDGGEGLGGDQEQRALRSQPTQGRCQFMAIDVGQAHVQNHKVENRILGGLGRLGAAARLGHVKVVGRDQLFGQGLAQVFLVVDQQDFFQSGHGCLLLLLGQSNLRFESRTSDQC